MRMRLVCLMVLAASAGASFPPAVAAAESQGLTVHERLQEEKTLGIDWFRAGFLGGVANIVGFRATLVEFKWRGAYFDTLQGGWMFSGSGEFHPSWYAFAGTEAGGLWVRGPHYVAVGTLVQFAMVVPGPSSCAPDRRHLLDFNLGLGVGPAVRYRYYVDRFGVEVSMEWPIVLGAGGVTTLWPIFGVSIGL